ncbi:glutamine--fructose-6-phosphate transaminase (isomerizing) [Candidatus Micrarchaeota archaeon CG10_big_fil_rev_8_21_14_0_10_45_29]|nr:MAG: glutamine--fructose-6-phosphate transaminase (isomerizing) [Candidatus Micrarchaeota archaeon CG10_big_fil_rev_8_21_14_0_10_45_29]
MCGIIGYIGKKKASELILSGLKKIEYRGYDSAGIAVMGKDGIKIIKGEGKLREIDEKKNFLALEGDIGIGHTRWATHGPPCERNAHPHTDAKGEVAIVHNGIIENFSKLKDELIQQGVKFETDTDTEVIAHLISKSISKSKDIEEGIREAILRLEGAYALGIIVKGVRKLFVARKNAPLVIGRGEGEMFFASDITALLEYTKKMILLEDGDFASLDEGGCTIYRIGDGQSVRREQIEVTWTAQMAQKEGHAHFMLKEIMQQPQALSAALSADVKDAVSLLKNSENLAIIGCGTSYYAALVFEYLMHKQGKGASSYIASEFNSWKIGNEDLIVAISQSGETADTLAALKDAKNKGAKIIVITNVMGSSITRVADVSIMIGVGPEIGVLATKSFLGQLAVLYKLAYTLSSNEKMLEKLFEAPAKVGEILRTSKENVQNLSDELVKLRDFFFISRGIGYPCALEGALKLKEVTYLHAESYPAGELKHGPISLLEENVAVFAIAPLGSTSAKMGGSIQECKARNAKVIVMSDDEALLKEGALTLRMPSVPEELVPLYYIVPLQMLSYFMAVKMQKDPDQPRNLAKSVTVE